MKTLQTTAFNKRLHDEIINLEELINKHVNPENISYFNPRLIDQATELLELKYQYANESNINGFQAMKLNTMVNYLKVASVETKTVFSQSSINHLQDDSLATKEFPIPDGFDGRNGFVSFHFKETAKTTKKSGLGLFNTRIVQTDTVTAVLTQTERKLIAKFHHMSGNPSGDHAYDICVSMVLWRYK